MVGKYCGNHLVIDLSISDFNYISVGKFDDSNKFIIGFYLSEN